MKLLTDDDASSAPISASSICWKIRDYCDTLVSSMAALTKQGNQVRFLCLHGGGANNAVTMYQLERLRAEVICCIACCNPDEATREACAVSHLCCKSISMCSSAPRQPSITLRALVHGIFPSHQLSRDNSMAHSSAGMGWIRRRIFSKVFWIRTARHPQRRPRPRLSPEILALSLGSSHTPRTTSS